MANVTSGDFWGGDSGGEHDEWMDGLDVVIYMYQGWYYGWFPRDEPGQR